MITGKCWTKGSLQHSAGKSTTCRLAARNRGTAEKDDIVQVERGIEKDAVYSVLLPD